MANKQLKNHFRAYEAMQLDAHFEERDLKFKQMELDPVTGQYTRQVVVVFHLLFSSYTHMKCVCYSAAQNVISDVFSAALIYLELFPQGKSVQRLVEITQPSKDLASVIRGSKVTCRLPQLYVNF